MKLSSIARKEVQNKNKEDNITKVINLEELIRFTTRYTLNLSFISRENLIKYVLLQVIIRILLLA